MFMDETPTLRLAGQKLGQRGRVQLLHVLRVEGNLTLLLVVPHAIVWQAIVLYDFFEHSSEVADPPGCAALLEQNFLAN